MLEILRQHKNKLKGLFSIIFIAVIVYFSYEEIRKIDFNELAQVLSSISRLHKVLIIVFGLLSFFACTLYDLYYIRQVGLELPIKEVLRVGWITESFDNFVGFGGLTGITLRDRYLNKSGNDGELVKREYMIIFMTEILGLLMIILFSFPVLHKLNMDRYATLLVIFCLYIPFYLWGDKIPYIKKMHLPIEYYSVKVRFGAILVSTFEWFVAALYFMYLIRLFEPHTNLYYGIIIYTLATLVGLFSMIPGGIGSFDIIIISVFGYMGHDPTNIAVSLLLYRVVYYLIPWVISLIMMGKDIMNHKIAPNPESIFWELGIKFVSFLVLATGIIFVLSAATPEILARVRIARHLLNREFLWFSKTLTLVIGILLIIFSFGIKKRIKKVYYATFSLLIIGGFSTMFKGLDFEEAVISLALASILFTMKDRFNIRGVKFSTNNFMITSGSVFVVTITYIAISNITKHVRFFKDHRPYSLFFLKQHIIQIIVFILAIILISSLIQFTKSVRIVFKPVVTDDVEKVDEFLRHYPGNEFTHLFYLYDKNVYFNDKNTVMIQYRPVNDFIFVLGDPIGNEQDFSDAIDDFIMWVDGFNMKVVFYQISGKKLEHYCDQGYKFVKVGQDAMLDLKTFTLSGRKNKTWRHVQNNFENDGYQFEIVDPALDIIDKCKKISKDWLGTKQEMRFSLGFFQDDYLKRSKIALVKDGDKIFAFATLQPFYDDQTISVDLMRFSKSAPAGVMDMIFLNLILWAQKEGYENFYLGMAPLSDVGNKKRSKKKEKIMKIVYNIQNNYYNFKGLRAYKEKFKPDWGNKYIAYDSDVNLPYILVSLGICTKAIQLKKQVDES